MKPCDTPAQYEALLKTVPLSEMNSKYRTTGPIFEPYYVVKREVLPAFGPGMLFCTHDKMDQMQSMLLWGFQFYEVPDVYMFQIEHDKEADAMIPTIRDAPRKMLHAGRLLCDIGGDEYSDAAGVQGFNPQFQLTLLSYMRWRQWHASWTTWFTSMSTEPEVAGDMVDPDADNDVQAVDLRPTLYSA